MSIEEDGRIIAEAQAAVALQDWFDRAIAGTRGLVLGDVVRNGAGEINSSPEAWKVAASIVVLADKAEALERRLEELERRKDGEEQA